MRPRETETHEELDLFEVGWNRTRKEGNKKCNALQEENPSRKTTQVQRAKRKTEEEQEEEEEEREEEKKMRLWRGVELQRDRLPECFTEGDGASNFNNWI